MTNTHLTNTQLHIWPTQSNHTRAQIHTWQIITWSLKIPHRSTNTHTHTNTYKYIFYIHMLHTYVCYTCCRKESTYVCYIHTYIHTYVCYICCRKESTHYTASHAHCSTYEASKFLTAIFSSSLWSFVLGLRRARPLTLINNLCSSGPLILEYLWLEVDMKKSTLDVRVSLVEMVLGMHPTSLVPFF